ncbi:MAG: hypothetical protein IJW80_03020, partial [Alistipes sp.]|nr:hypothetical protein [Alistipes sp.]
KHREKERKQQTGGARRAQKSSKAIDKKITAESAAYLAYARNSAVSITKGRISPSLTINHQKWLKRMNFKACEWS